MKKFISLLLIAFWFLSCDPGYTPSPEDTNTVEVENPGSTIIQPPASSNEPVTYFPEIYDLTPNSPFTINKGNLFPDPVTNNFIYGIIEVTYNGTAVTTYVPFTCDFYNSDNVLLYHVEGFLYNKVKKYRNKFDIEYFDDTGMSYGETAIMPITTSNISHDSNPNGPFTIQDIAYMNITIDTANTGEAVILETEDKITLTDPVTYNKTTRELSLSLENTSLIETFTNVSLFYYGLNSAGEYISLGFFKNDQMDSMGPGHQFRGTETINLNGSYIDTMEYRLLYSR